MVLPELGQEIALDDTGRDNILQNVQALASHVELREEVDLHRLGRLGVGVVANHVHPLEAHMPWSLAQKVAEEHGRSLENADQADLFVARVAPDVDRELADT